MAQEYSPAQHTLTPEQLNILAFAAGKFYVECVTAASAAIFAYDYIHSFEAEVTSIWPTRMSVGKVLFLISRYSAFIDIPAFLYFTFSRNLPLSSCRDSLVLANVFSFIGTASSEAILAFSLYALLGARKKYGILISIIYTIPTLVAGFLLVLMLLGIQYTPTSLPVACRIYLPRVNYSMINYAILLAGEIMMTLVAILLGLRRYRRSKSPFMSVLVKGGSLYYLALLGFSLLNVSSQFWLPWHLANMFFPVQRIMHPILSNRLLLNMRKDDDGEPTFVLSELRFAENEIPKGTTSSEVSAESTTSVCMHMDEMDGCTEYTQSPEVSPVSEFSAGSSGVWSGPTVLGDEERGTPS